MVRGETNRTLLKPLQVETRSPAAAAAARREEPEESAARGLEVIFVAEAAAKGATRRGRGPAAPARRTAWKVVETAIMVL